MWFGNWFRGHLRSTESQTDRKNQCASVIDFADLLVQLGTLLIREQTRDKFKMRFFCKANIGQLYLQIFDLIICLTL